MFRYLRVLWVLSSGALNGFVGIFRLGGFWECGLWVLGVVACWVVRCWLGWLWLVVFRGYYNVSF